MAFNVDFSAKTSHVSHRRVVDTTGVWYICAAGVQLLCVLRGCRPVVAAGVQLWNSVAKSWRFHEL